MDNLIGRYRNVSILAAAIFLQIVGLAVQVKRRSENHSTRLIRVWTVAAVTPLERSIVGLQTGVSDLWHNYLYLRGVRQQNRELQEQIQQLQLEQVRLRQDAQQASRLQALLGFKEQFIDKTTAAQVIGSSGSELSRIVYLDKGSADGITQDMAVISAQGVVGKVIQVFRHTAQVLLISDQTSGVGTILEQSRLQGVLKGKASGDLVLDNIMSEEEVKPGDRVLTSGGDQIFPKGLPVGTVEKVTRGTEFLQVTVRPAASLNHLEEVLVITRKQEREPATASTATPVRAADILAQRLPSVPDKPEQPVTGSTAATNAPSAAIPAKPQPKTPAPAAGTGTNVRAPAVAPNVDAATSVPKSTAPTPVPRTQPVDFVRTNPAASSQTSAVGIQPKPKANLAAPTPGGVGASQPKAPAVSAATQPKALSPTPAKVPAAGTKTPAAITPPAPTNATAPGTTAATKTNNSATVPSSNAVSAPKKATTAAPQPKPKPASPSAAKPVANTPQPATQPDASGDTPQ